ncbi:MAG: hypothetical protein R2874_05200 [Desulfobacterales bacterium]
MAVSYARQLPPGGTGQITLKLKTDGKAGEIIRHQATLYTDDPENATILLTMTGKVVAPAEIDPKAARLIGPAGSPVHARVKITPVATNLFQITSMLPTGKTSLFVWKKNQMPAPLFILDISNTRKDPGRYSDRLS